MHPLDADPPTSEQTHFSPRPREGQRRWCPYCPDFYCSTTLGEIKHMQDKHPQIIEKRLREIGELPPA